MPDHNNHAREVDHMRRLGLATLFLFALASLALPAASRAQNICITMAPPELPVYEQPAIPAPGYLWTPGYWAYGSDGYFWVPGTWVLPPTVGMLWTPGYWGWRDGNYAWNAGYWGPHVGFYGGVNYGFGYVGVGFEGGRWDNGVFAYNRAVTNFGSVTITNVYEKTVIVDANVTRTSFNGGTGGTKAEPTAQEQAAAHEQHVTATPAQSQHQETASTNKALLASENHGQPAIAATAKPGEFSGKGVVAAREVKPTGPGAPATKPSGIGTLDTKPTGAGTPATKPNGIGTLDTKPTTGAGTPNTKPSGIGTLDTKPAGAGEPSTKPTGARESEKKEPAGKDHATLNGGNPPKPLNTEVKPVVTAPPPQAVKPKPPQPVPAATAAVKPPPPPPAKPAARPACPPGKTMTPAGCK
jgi:hypothetical protein